MSILKLTPQDFATYQARTSLLAMAICLAANCGAVYFAIRFMRLPS